MPARRFVLPAVFVVSAACASKPSASRAPIAEEPLVLSPARDAGTAREPTPGSPGPSEVAQGNATPCPRGKSVPFGFDLVPEKMRPPMRKGVSVLETIRFTVSNLVGVPRQIEIVEADQLGASGALKPDWEAAHPMIIKQAYFEGGAGGPPGMPLLLPAYAATTAIIELDPVPLHLPKRGIRVHVRVDGRPACFEQSIARPN